MNPRLHSRELAYILDHSEARACFATSDLADVLALMLAECPAVERLIDVSGAEYAALKSGEPIALTARSPTDPAWLFYTSGTTGRPKGAELSHRNLLTMTGDVAVMDKDGFITLKDRSKDAVISGGSNIYPREVEEVLLRHPAGAEVSVIGRPDPEWGESVVAFIARVPGREVTNAELDALCLENIARYKKPKAYRYIEALPKSHIGKILKAELRKMLSEDDA